MDGPPLVVTGIQQYEKQTHLVFSVENHFEKKYFTCKRHFNYLAKSDNS